RYGRGRIGRGEIELVAAVVAELEQRGADLEPLGALDQPAPIGAAAELAVGDDRKPDLLLHAHRGADAVVRYARELAVVDLADGMAPKALPQRGRPQHAADVVGPERREARRAEGGARTPT